MWNLELQPKGLVFSLSWIIQWIWGGYFLDTTHWRGIVVPLKTTHSGTHKHTHTFGLIHQYSDTYLFTSYITPGVWFILHKHFKTSLCVHDSYFFKLFNYIPSYILNFNKMFLQWQWSCQSMPNWYFFYIYWVSVTEPVVSMAISAL